MKQIGLLAAVVVCATLVLPRLAAAQTAPAIPPSITTPDKVETRIGTLDFKDGAPSKATVDKVYDNLDFTHAQRAFVDTLQGVSIHAIRKGLQSVGVKDNEVLIFSELMDAKSLFLTANADTIYVVGALDLTKGPMVLETPPEVLGAIQDYWFRWVIDIGLPGPDRGEGGKYLIVPPGYDGPLPEGGFFVARSRTNHVMWFAPLVPGEQQRSQAGGRTDPEVHQGLSVRGRRRRHAHRRVPGRQSPARPDHAAAADRVPRRQRQGDEHHSAQRLQLLRDAQRDRAAGTGHLARPRADGADRRHRHRQGQAVRARRADEEDPHRGARVRQRHLAQPVHESARSELVLLSRLGVVELAVRFRLRVRDADPDDHARRASSPSRRPATGNWTRADGSSTASPASRRRWPCA